ncbi:helicase-related protein [Calderihabitans maritimus]|nr:helicase-related protein [Calderihabitans maritimus]
MNAISNLRNKIVKGPYWPEPVEINFIEESSGYVHIVGVTLQSKVHVDQLLSEEELSRITVIDANAVCNEEPWKVFLALEATRYKLASLFDPLLAMNSSKVDPLPHQIETVYGYVLKLPRIRFLIADDPGAGKTIMAGLIIKELKLRNIVRRILIVAPGHLKDQWRRELKERFNENFVPVDRNFMEAFYAENIWDRENQIVTSIDFAKQEDVMRSIAASHFDLIIVDEAHKMSAYRYGQKTEKTIRYKLGEVLSKKTEHLLFLTATPHKGDSENFRLFLDLLEPGFFATADMVQESIQNKENPLFIRHVKEDLKDFEGKPLFLPRHVMTKTFNLGVESPREKKLYNDLSVYVNTQYNKAIAKDKKRNVAFALVILQRRFASSVFALWKSLERRKKRLEELLTAADNYTLQTKNIDFEDVEDMNEENRWKTEEMWEALSVSENKEELKKEIETLTNLIQQAKAIVQSEEEAKLRQLKFSLRELEAKYNDPRDKKILIFTESRDTLTYLEEKIREWGYSVNTIHGGMKLEERINEEKRFKNETQIMVATEAAGEGINLQFCHLMINYDIPWNPTRLEQRMGRIHRYGQQKEVYVINLVAEDTREGQVLKRLFDKLEEIKEALGHDKVFDCLGEILNDKNLAQLLMEAAAKSRRLDEILKDIDITVNPEYIARVKENLGESLATRFIDYTRIKEMAEKAREYRLIPEYTENFFKKAFSRAGGKYRELGNGVFSIDSIPFDIRKIAEEENFKKAYGSLLKRYPRVTFDKDIAFRNQDVEFICFGHPLFEAVMEWIQRHFGDSPLRGTTFIDPAGKYDGYLCFYEAEVKDGSNKVAGKRLFSFYVSDLGVREVSPAILWDFKEADGSLSACVDIEALRKQTFGYVVKRLEAYREELARERERQAQIKERYGIKSLEYLITKLDNELIDLYIRKENGENVDIVIYNKNERKKEYEKALADLKNEIQKERSLTLGMPRFKGVVRVIPAETIPEAMRSSEEIETIGMEIAMQYEREHGRSPEDVSSENLGFDIRSKDEKGNIRYIEVKARAGVGPVALTPNEWFKAQRLGDDYYLYTILNAGKKPELYIVRNPAKNLKPEEKLEIVRYIVSAQKIKEEADQIGK